VSLPPLATADDVAARLGRDLTGAEEVRLGPLLTDASAQVRRYCRRDFAVHTNETHILYAHDSEIYLPGKPATAVSGIVAYGGGSLPDFTVPWWAWDGLQIVRIAPGYGIINLPEAWMLDDSYPGTYQVTYSWGEPEVPDVVVMVVANAALSVLTAPTAAAGVIGETIGAYSYRMERGGGGVSVALTAADLATLKDYRLNVATLAARLR
jgi:hypothetical protein